MLVEAIKNNYPTAGIDLGQELLQFSDWLDIIDEHVEMRGQLSLVLNFSDIRILKILRGILHAVMQRIHFISSLPEKVTQHEELNTFIYTLDAYRHDIASGKLDENVFHDLHLINGKLQLLLQDTN